MLAERFSVRPDDVRFGEFVKKHRQDLLELEVLPEDSPLPEKVAALARKEPDAYSMERLKWYVSQVDIKKIVIVVDDVEGQAFAVQRQILMDVCRLNHCLRNYEGRQYHVLTLFSIRPTTYRLFLEKDGAQLSAFSPQAPIVIDNPISILDVFEARFETAIEVLGIGEVRNREAWEDARDVLRVVANRLSEKKGEMIQLLYNNNTREALVEYSRILLNKAWFQRSQPEGGNFRITPGNYPVNTITVFRAMAYGDGRVYPCQETAIVNILRNSIGGEDDMLCVYVIRAIVNATGGSPYASIKRGDLVRWLMAVFKYPGFGERLIEVLSFMRDGRLLDVHSVGDGEKAVEYVALLPRSLALMEIMSDRAVLLEFYRDDCYIDVERGMECPLMDVGPDLAPVAIAGYLAQLVQSERKHINHAFANATSSEFVKRFGRESVTAVWVEALERTLHAIYDRKPWPQQVVGIMDGVRVNVDCIRRDLASVGNVTA